LLRRKMKMNSLAFEDNEVLFGADPEESIVAVEPVADNTMRVFHRKERRVEADDRTFTPFLVIQDEGLIKGFKRPYRLERLSSANDYRFLVILEGWEDCQRARAHLQKKSGEPPSSHQAPYLYISDPVHQFLSLTGKTLFKGLDFKALHRLALDIETGCAPGYEFSNPTRKEDKIISIALMDNQGYSAVLFGKEMDEEEMLVSLGDRISKIDPDVIEGHNIFNFDLNYISERAKMHGIALGWGRDGSTPQIRRSRFTVAERIIDYNRMEIFGRHVVDTMFLLQYYDVTARELESYGLKSAARHFGLAEEDRTYIQGKDIQWYYDHKPETLKKYNIEDVRETLALSSLIGYPFFLQARMFPYSYQNIFVRGNATKINALFLREYLRKRTSIPKPKGGGEFEGGYTDIFVTGVVRDVVHCDVASLYPSLMLAYGLKPAGDILGVFPKLLEDLRAFRLDAKERALKAKSPHVKDYYQGLQQTFKILINSFYGYLGTELHHFSDPKIAAEVTRSGRETIRQMLGWLRREGVYFVPPPSVKTEAQANALVQRLSDTLPERIEVSMDGRYRAMFSYKKKNYALLDDKGDMVIKGSALRSRGMEKYLREFLSSMIELLLKGNGAEVEDLLKGYMEKIERHEMGVTWFAKTEALRESLDSYKKKVQFRKRNPSALYELAIASHRDFRAGDQLSYYVTGHKKNVRAYENCRLASSYDPGNPDENTAFYRDKLLSLHEKFSEFLPPRNYSDRLK
jgi:DNA polymerase I